MSTKRRQSSTAGSLPDMSVTEGHKPTDYDADLEAMSYYSLQHGDDVDHDALRHIRRGDNASIITRD